MHLNSALSVLTWPGRLPSVALLLALLALVDQKCGITPVICKQNTAILTWHIHHLPSAPPILKAIFALPWTDCVCACLCNGCCSTVLCAGKVAWTPVHFCMHQPQPQSVHLSVWSCGDSHWCQGPRKAELHINPDIWQVYHIWQFINPGIACATNISSLWLNSLRPILLNFRISHCCWDEKTDPSSGCVLVLELSHWCSNDTNIGYSKKHKHAIPTTTHAGAGCIGSHYNTTCNIQILVTMTCAVLVLLSVSAATWCIWCQDSKHLIPTCPYHEIYKFMSHAL